MSEVKLDEDLLKKKYHNTSVTELAKHFGVARGTITRRAKKLGLEKEESYYAKKGELSANLSKPLNNYFVTNYGRVVNAVTNKVLKPKLADTGYPKITFQINKKKYERYLHRLIAESFIPNPHNKPFINHSDGVKTNYTITNLEWNTPKENAEHASRTGLLKVGEESGRSHITESQAKRIIEALNNGERNCDIVRNFDFATRSIVEKIKNKRKWKHLL